MTEPQSPSSHQPANGSQEQHQSSIPPSSAQPQTSTDTPDSAIKPDPELDASLDQDIVMSADQAGAGADENATGALATEVDQLAESSQPSKKETSLREFLGKMDEYAPIVGDPRVHLFSFNLSSLSSLPILHRIELFAPVSLAKTSTWEGTIIANPSQEKKNIRDGCKNQRLIESPRSPTPSQRTTSLSPASHPPAQALTKHPLISPASSHSPLKSSSPTLPLIHTSSPASAPPTAPPPTTPWAV